jgi:hypothetical protein
MQLPYNNYGTETMTDKFTVAVYGMFIPIPEKMRLWNFVGFSPMII